MKIQTGDLLKVNKGIIGHQVNCQGKMGKGLAGQIRKKYPQVYEDYIKAYENNKLDLGKNVYTKITNDFYIASLPAQKYYGNDGKRYTDYCALCDCLIKLKYFAEFIETEFIYLPYELDCGYGGADWDDVKTIIDLACPDAIVLKLI